MLSKYRESLSNDTKEYNINSDIIIQFNVFVLVPSLTDFLFY